MKPTTTTLPTGPLWAINVTRVRAGQGPVKVVPKSFSCTTSGGVPIGVYFRGSLYFWDELFETEQEAKDHGKHLASHLIDRAVQKHNKRLALYFKAYHECAK